MNVPLVAKMSIQQKIADLEARVEKLEKATVTRTVTTTTVKAMNLDPEMSGIFKQMDALFKKVFG